jgi:hypothetical protein
MWIVFTILFCLIAAVLIFGITFHDELMDEEQRKQRLAKVISIEAGKRCTSKVDRRVV